MKSARSRLMVWIALLAGCCPAVAGRGAAPEPSATLTLHVAPAGFVPGADSPRRASMQLLLTRILNRAGDEAARRLCSLRRQGLAGGGLLLVSGRACPDLGSYLDDGLGLFCTVHDGHDTRPIRATVPGGAPAVWDLVEQVDSIDVSGTLSPPPGRLVILERAGIRTSRGLAATLRVFPGLPDPASIAELLGADVVRPDGLAFGPRAPGSSRSAVSTTSAPLSVAITHLEPLGRVLAGRLSSLVGAVPFPSAVSLQAWSDRFQFTVSLATADQAKAAEQALSLALLAESELRPTARPDPRTLAVRALSGATRTVVGTELVVSGPGEAAAFMEPLLVHLASPRSFELLTGGDEARRRCREIRLVLGRAAAHRTQERGSAPFAVQALVREGYLHDLPSCPSRGTFSFDRDGSIVCSRHGGA